MTVCGHLKRDKQTYCTQPAGWGTDHFGEGYCKLHGGNNKRGTDHHNFKTGQYSMYRNYVSDKLKGKLDVFLEREQPLDLQQELALTRALLAEFMSRFVEGTFFDAISISIASDLIERINKTAATISKIKNETALTAAEVKYLQMRAVDVALKYFPDDPQKQQQFIADLFGLDTGSGGNRPELVEGQATRTSR